MSPSEPIGLSLILGMMAVLTFVLLWMATPILWRAIRTGQLQARGIVYDRDHQPGMFYAGVIFWISLIVILGLVSTLLVAHWISDGAN
jgi:hypothetical protein